MQVRQIRRLHDKTDTNRDIRRGFFIWLYAIALITFGFVNGITFACETVTRSFSSVRGRGRPAFSTHSVGSKQHVELFRESERPFF